MSVDVGVIVVNGEERDSIMVDSFQAVIFVNVGMVPFLDSLFGNSQR